MIIGVFATEPGNHSFAYTMFLDPGLYVSGDCDGGANAEMCGFGLELLLAEHPVPQPGDSVDAPTNNPDVHLRFTVTDKIRPKAEVEAFQSMADEVRIVEIEVLR